MQFHSKNLIHFTKLNSLDIQNKMFPQHSQKPFWFHKFSSKHVSVGVRKFPKENFYFREVVKILSGGGGWVLSVCAWFQWKFLKIQLFSVSRYFYLQ